MAESKQVLVIDDDPDFCSYVQIVLAANGYDVRLAASADEGLALMRAQPPSLVIVDLMMSYALDGWTVSREMRADARLRTIPVLVVSAVVNDRDNLLFPNNDYARMDAFLSKPVAPAALLEQVAALTGTG